MTAPPPTDETAVQRILTTARSGSLPQGWYVWHLRRDRVLRAALGWTAIAAFGFLLLIPTALATIPSNFTGGATVAVLTVLLLGLLASIAFGGLYLTVGDLLRYTRADAYLLVMTPDDFLLVTPRKTIHVPMTSVAYVTLKGIRVHTPPAQTVTPTLGGLGWLFGAGAASRSTSRRGAPSLAFLDLRTRSEVVVATDNTFDDLPVLEEILSLHAKGQVAAESGGRTDR